MTLELGVTAVAGGLLLEVGVHGDHKDEEPLRLHSFVFLVVYFIH